MDASVTPSTEQHAAHEASNKISSGFGSLSSEFLTFWIRKKNTKKKKKKGIAKGEVSYTLLSS